MSSKFFTWTKGDRRNATDALRSGGVVPIPAECLSIKGMDYARGAKGKHHRKPLPLPLDQGNYDNPSYGNRTSDSIALHDAAVQSATSLMAVMNDMLRSPQLSAHISSHYSSDLAPTFARPRSHTAPSTPLVEAPSREPVELPGSLPLSYKKSHSSLPYRTKNASDTELARPHHSTVYGSSIFRPHSSPPEKQSAPFFAANTSTDSLVARPDLRLPTASDSPNPRSTDLIPPSYHDGVFCSIDVAGGTLVGSDAASLAFSKRPSLSVVQPRRCVSPSNAGSTVSSHGGSSTVVPQVVGVPTQNDAEDLETVLLEEISRLRASQDAHVCSLKEAHEKELACQKSYIAFLEKRRVPTAHSALQQSERLTIDTSRSHSRTELYSEPSATTVKSFESCLEDQKRASQEAVAEAEALKRKLSLCKKAQGDAVELRKERNNLRDAAERSDRRIVQLKDIIRKAKENERALRNQTIALEARLVEANNERTDVLEGFHNACSQVRTANERERRLAQELDESRAQMSQRLGVSATIPQSEHFQSNKAKHGRAASDAGTWDSTPPRMDPTMRQLIESRRVLAAKDARIQELERTVANAADQGALSEPQQDHLAHLESQLQQTKQQLHASQSDAERYNSLLHNELRRQARNAAQNAESRGPAIEAESFMVASEKMTRLRRRAGTASWRTGTTDTTSAPLPVEASAAILAATLEKELDHCIREIIMYKLDVKGYRKDLKKANAELEDLRAMSIQRPPTPDRESVSSVRSQRSQQSQNTGGASRGDGLARQAQAPAELDPGLGITLPQPPKTPTKPSSVAAATAAALSPPLTSPPPRAKTPLNAHKKLPKPPAPSRTPSPLPSATYPSGIHPSVTKPKWPERDVARTETLRSVSESIISSYAKRNKTDSEPLPGEPSSEPLGSFASPPTSTYPARLEKAENSNAV